MSNNPFDDDTIQHLVLVNEEGQHSMWPQFAEVPAGWVVTHGPGKWADCLAYVERNWTDMRPKSLQEQLERP